jgi:hypothetical protein
MIAPLFYGTINKGKLILETPQRYLVHLSGLEGKKVELVLRKRKSKRSINQNSAYWGIAIEILCEKTGYTKEQMHFALKEKFASTIDPVTGLRIVESTAAMNTVRFNKYYADIQQWAIEFLDCYIPDPNEIPDYEVAL